MTTTFVTHTDTPLELITAAHMNTVQTAISNLETGWIASEDTWVYVTAATFKIVAKDVTSTYTAGTKLKCTNSSAKYFYVVSSAFVTDTTVTIAVSTTAACILASAAITVPFYSYATNPQGFPAAMAYTPTGIAATNVVLTGKFRMDGSRCTVDFKAAFSNTITFTSMPTLPIAASASFIGGSAANFAVVGSGSYWDNGTAYAAIWPTVLASGTTFGLYSTAGATMSASAPITWANTDEINAHFSYEV